MSPRYLLQRLSSLLVVLLGVSILTFAIIPLIPGAPARVRLGVQATPETVAAVRAQLGLDRPLVVQYWDWLTGIVTRGDFGESLISSRPIAPEIARRLPATLTLALAALVIGLLIALPLGLVSALRPGSKTDLGASVFSQVGVSVPDFWMGILLILLFGAAGAARGGPVRPHLALARNHGHRRSARARAQRKHPLYGRGV